MVKVRGAAAVGILVSAVLLLLLSRLLQSWPPMPPLRPSVFGQEETLLRSPKSPHTVPGAVTGSLAVVSATSANHLCSAVQMAGSLQRFAPGLPLILYSLHGETLGGRELCAAAHELIDPHNLTFQCRVFPYANFPDFFDVRHNKGSYAWKAPIVHQVLQEYDHVLWMDAGNKIVGRHLEAGVRHTLFVHQGFASFVSHNDRIERRTVQGSSFCSLAVFFLGYPALSSLFFSFLHLVLLLFVCLSVYLFICIFLATFPSPSALTANAVVRSLCTGTFDALKDPKRHFRQEYLCNGNFLAFSRQSPSYEKIVLPWVNCSVNKSCIAPDGSHVGNHRQDMSVVSLLAAMAGTPCRHIMDQHLHGTGSRRALYQKHADIDITSQTFSQLCGGLLREGHPMHAFARDYFRKHPSLRSSIPDRRQRPDPAARRARLSV